MSTETFGSEAEAPAIEIRGLRSQFGSRVIHEDLDLTVERGEILGVVGGSGSGKSVMLNTIIGLKRPEGGSVHVFGHDIHADPRRRERTPHITSQWGAHSHDQSC
jgi:phospholipid/cholesterol/gamma-HCH transport system ATP-binding protein